MPAIFARPAGARRPAAAKSEATRAAPAARRDAGEHPPASVRAGACPCGGGCPRCAGAGDAAPAGVHRVLASPGRPLPPPVRLAAGNLEHVRIHDDAAADASARAVNARAYTVGRHVVFARGEYAPDVPHGRELLAHELTHVRQQDPDGAAGAPPDRLAIAPDHDASEQSARQAAGRRSGWAAPAEPRSPFRVQRQVAAAADPHYDLTLNLPPQPPEHHAGLGREEALRVLRHFRNRINAVVEGGAYGHQSMIDLRNEQYIVGAISDVLGGVSLPPISIWSQPRAELARAQEQLDAGNIAMASRYLQVAALSAHDCQQQVTGYREGTIAGAERSVTGLEVVEVAAAATVTIGTGGAAGVVVGAGYGALQTAARQGSELHLGMRREIDWGGIAFDALFGIITGYLGGRLGNAVLGRLLRNPAAASLGQKALAHLTSDLVAGRVSSVLQTAAHSLFDQLRGREQLTFEQFVDRLAAQLTDPRGAFFDIILGHAARRATAARPAATETASASGTRRSRFGSGLRARLVGAAMRGMVEAAPITGGTGGGPSSAVVEHLTGAPTEISTPAAPATPPAVAPAPGEVSPVQQAAAPVVEAPAPAAAPAATPAAAEAAPAPAAPAAGHDALDVELDQSFQATFTEAAPAQAPAAPTTQAPEVTAGFQTQHLGPLRRLFGRAMSSSGINDLARVWNSVANPGEAAALNLGNSRRLFNNQRNRFWRAVRQDPAARQVFLDAGFTFGPNPTTAPTRTLADGTVMQATIDHMTERQTDPTRALDPTNLQVSSRLENTVLLRQLHDQDPFQ